MFNPNVTTLPPSLPMLDGVSLPQTSILLLFSSINTTTDSHPTRQDTSHITLSTTPSPCSIMNSCSNSHEQTFNFLLDRIAAQNTTIDILARRLFSMDTRMDTISQQVHTNTNRIDTLTTAVDTSSRRLDKNNSSQPFSNRDPVHKANKTNSGNNITLNTASDNSTRQKLDLQDLPGRIRANISNIEALAEWMGDVAASVESLEVQVGEQQQREDRVPGHDGQGLQDEYSLADDMDSVDQDQSESRFEGALASDSRNPSTIDNIFDDRQMPQQLPQQQQQHSKDQDGNKEEDAMETLDAGWYVPGTEGVVEQSDRLHTETEKGGADDDEISLESLNVCRRPETGMVGLRGPEVIVIGENSVDNSPDHSAENKSQSLPKEQDDDDDEEGLQDDVKDDLKEMQQTTRVASVGGSTLAGGAPRTKLFKKNSICSRLFDQVASLYPQLSEAEVQALPGPFQLPSKMPKTIDGIWDFWFVSEEGRPSIWQLEAYVKKWKATALSTTGGWFFFKGQKIIVESVLQTISTFPEGSTLEARVLAAKDIVGEEIAAVGSMLKYVKKMEAKKLVNA